MCIYIYMDEHFWYKNILYVLIKIYIYIISTISKKKSLWLAETFSLPQTDFHSCCWCKSMDSWLPGKLHWGTTGWWFRNPQGNNQLTCIKPVVNNGNIDYQAQLLSLPDFWSINSMVHMFFFLGSLERDVLRGGQGRCWNNLLVGGFNPFKKYARQIGNLPQFSGWK